MPGVPLDCEIAIDEFREKVAAVTVPDAVAVP
jgi:hypothetical protein